jgi:hypothetical protein
VRKNVGMLVHTTNFGTARKTKYGMRVCVENFGSAWKNICVRVRALNLTLCSVHMHKKVRTVYTHNNDARGVCRVGRAQRSFVVVRTMWVYVVAR